MTSFKRRLEALEAALKDKMAERRLHDLVVQLRKYIKKYGQ